MKDIKISDAELEPALEALLIDKTPEVIGPVDFRSLSVREFGTIYEGLLESHMVAAQVDLAEDGHRQYRPTRSDEPPVITAGEVYFSHRSGIRKTTGSYFTPDFAVEHLLDKALEPALDVHIARLERLHAEADQDNQAKAFFDFRCADIAMGSGHFLTAALDRIERRLSGWLTTHPVPGVSAELTRLRQVAENELAGTGIEAEFSDSALLRRQIAKRCVYGVDINNIAVELARLAVWIHTFIPGLPLSFLDHNLVRGDSLVGVGTIDEAEAALKEEMDALDKGELAGQGSFPRLQIKGLLEDSRQALDRLARTSDATKAEIEEAEEAHKEAQQKVEPARAIFDFITARRDGQSGIPTDFGREAIIDMASTSKVRDCIHKRRPTHFPAVFPEVFLREWPGFDCLIGNPPWDKVVVSDKVWFGQHLPGIRSLDIQDMKAKIAELIRERPDLDADYEKAKKEAKSMRKLLRVTFPRMGSGDTDLSKAFAWRNWQLVREQGYVGVVLPRAVTRGAGSEKWRKEILDLGTFSDVTTLSNKGGWAFDDLHQMYGVALLGLKKTREATRIINLAGPHNTLEKFEARESKQIPLDEFVGWSDDATFPDIPDHEGALKLFRKLRESQSIKSLSIYLSLSLCKRLRIDSDHRVRYARSTLQTTRICSFSTQAHPPYCRNPRHSRQEAAHLRQRSLSNESQQPQLACLWRARHKPLGSRDQ